MCWSSSCVYCDGVSHDAVALQLKYEQNQKALRMVLEDSTLEEAMWALSQVTGFCHLSLRPRQDGTCHHMHIKRFVCPVTTMVLGSHYELSLWRLMKKLFTVFSVQSKFPSNLSVQDEFTVVCM